MKTRFVLRIAGLCCGLGALVCDAQTNLPPPTLRPRPPGGLQGLRPSVPVAPYTSTGGMAAARSLTPPVLPPTGAAAVAGTASAATTKPATAATTGRTAPAAAGQDTLLALNFKEAPLDQLLSLYGELTGKTIIKAPAVTAVISLRSQNKLTKAEALQAMDTVLAMNNISMVPMGEKFLKLVQANVGRLEGMPLTRVMPDKALPETDQLVSHIVQLKYMEVSEAQAVIQGVLHGFGKVQPIERTRSLLVTDTSANLQRIMEILEFADQQFEGRVETKIYEMKHGEAAAIAGKLNELIADAQAKEDKARAAAPAPTPVMPTVPMGVIRAPRPTTLDTATLGERELVQGRVKILADERTNIILLISRPVNFPLFDRIIEVLDRQVDPEVIARVQPLRWADVGETAALLNALIGGNYSGGMGTTGTRAVGAGGTTTRTTTGTGTGTGIGTGTTTGRSTTTSGSGTTAGTSSRYGSRSTASSRLGGGGGGALPSGYMPGAASTEQLGLGQISPYTRVLPDLRTNSLLLMGTKQDLLMLQQVIDQLDVMLAQVLIEAVILEVELSKETSMGINWLQRSMMVYNKSNAGPGGGLVTRQAVGSFGGGWSAGGGSLPDSAAINKGFALPQGLTYYSTITGLNIDAVLKMLATSSDARILSTPVIMATDNTQAEIKNTEQRPVVTTTSTYAINNGGVLSSYEYRDIGIDLIVTPHINPNRMVIMDISQTADSLGGEVTINNNQVPIINKREIKGSITVENRSTIVLGGLVKTDDSKSRTKVPFLGDIPFLGALFRTDDNKSGRTELLVLITPYVLQTPEEARAETARLHRESTMQEVMTKGWIDSPLAKPDPGKVHQQQHDAWKQAKVRDGASPLPLQPLPPAANATTTNAAASAPATPR